MLALKGYYNGKTIVPLEKVNSIKENQKVIITVLDEYINDREFKEKPYKKYIGVLKLDSFKEIEEALKDVERIDEDEW